MADLNADGRVTLDEFSQVGSFVLAKVSMIFSASLPLTVLGHAAASNVRENRHEQEQDDREERAVRLADDHGCARGQAERRIHGK
jgi:hypothetical protein